MLLTLEIAETKAQKKLCDDFVIANHSYVASAKTVGRVIKYAILIDNDICGTFWLGSGFKPTPKDLLRHLDVSQKQFDFIFNSIADNKRFCMKTDIPNLGSQVLKKIRQRAATDWEYKYGNSLKGIVTTIGGGKSGAVYKADNWVVIGSTSGLPAARKSVSMKWNDEETIAKRFVKPTGENKKMILFTDKLKPFDR